VSSTANAGAPARNRVLVVDDEPGMLRMLKAVLAQYGFVTEEACSGDDALKLLSKRSFDVIVSDINMPGLDGLDFVREVRERDFRLPIITITGRPTEQTGPCALALGVFRCLVKPVMPMVLNQTILAAIRAHDEERGTNNAVERQSTDEQRLQR
jgi:DNA-binding response OmpR family regulator